MTDTEELFGKLDMYHLFLSFIITKEILLKSRYVRQEINQNAENSSLSESIPLLVNTPYFAMFRVACYLNCLAILHNLTATLPLENMTIN